MRNATEGRKRVVNNRARGRQGENEAAAILGGHRISRTGEAGSDIVDKVGRTWECKRLKTWPARMAGWMAQSASQGDHGIIARADRGKWYVIIPVENYVGGDYER